MLGTNTISVRTCPKCQNFEAGDLENKMPRAGCTSLHIDEESQRLLSDNVHHTCRILALDLNSSPQTVCSHLHKLNIRNTLVHNQSLASTPEINEEIRDLVFLHVNTCIIRTTSQAERSQ